MEISPSERSYRAELSERPGARAPASFGEIWDAEYTRSRLNNTLFGLPRHVSESHDELVAAIEGASGRRIGELAREHGVAFDGTVEGRIAALGRLVDFLPEEQRAAIEPLRDVRARGAEKAQKIEREAGEVAAATYGLSGVAVSFLAGIAGQMVDPGVIAANLATAPIGGPFKGAFLRVVLRQGAAGAAGQAILEPAIQKGRGELGLESGFALAAGNVLEAGVGSAGLTAVLRIGAAGLRAARGGLNRSEISEPGRVTPPDDENRTSGLPTSSDLFRGQGDVLRARLASLLGPEDLEAAARLTERNHLLELQTRHRDAAAELEAAAGALEQGRTVDRAALALGEPIGAGAATRARSLDPNRFAPVDGEDRQFIIRPGGGRLPVTERVVELRDLIVSHDLEGRPNAAYPAELQPRDRAAPASRAFVAERAAVLEPELLGRSPSAATGAPVIGPDGVVESGNGRVMMIARAYDRHPERAAAYREFLAREGHDVDGMEFPVLVRVRDGELPIAERAAFAREANVAPVAAMSVRERAFADVKALDESLLAGWRGGNVASAENAAFVRAFADRVVAPEERPNFIGPDDRISAEGARRVEAALVARAWDAPDIVAALYESAEPTSRAILGAFADTAPLVARLRAAVAEGRVPADVDPAPALIEAFRLVDRARGTGLKVADALEQLDLERGAVPEPVKDAARLYFRDDQFRLAAGRDAIAARIEQAVNRALDQQNAIGDLFGATFDKAGTLRAAKLAGQPIDELDLFAGAAAGVVHRPTLPIEDFLAQRARLTAAQPFKTLDEAIALAKSHQPRLVAALAEAVGDAGRVKDPGVKTNRARMEQKIEEKYRGDVRGLTDLVRAGVVVNTPEEANAIAAALGRTLRVIDEGWFRNEAGYLDRKLEIVFPDGMMAEVQLWPDAILEAKLKGEAMYVQRRAAPPEARAALLALEKQYWAEVHARLDASWSELIGGSPNASISSANAARAASSASGRPSQVTSASSTARQPSLPTDQARPPATTATVEPQANQRVSEGAGINASNENLSRPAGESKVPSALAQDAERALADVGDFEIALTDPDGTVRKLSARQALAEAQEDAAAAAELTACIGEELAA